MRKGESTALSENTLSFKVSLRTPKSSRPTGSAFQVLLLVLCFCSLASCKRAAVGIAPGNTAPSVSGISDAGQSFSLENLRGRFVLLNFWATWCAPCVMEMPELEKLQQSFDASKFQIVAVTVDDQLEAVKEFRARYQLSFPLIVDSSRKSGAGYKLTGVPETVLVDPQGKIVLFQDPESGEATTKVIGPRDWASKASIKSIQNALRASAKAAP